MKRISVFLLLILLLFTISCVPAIQRERTGLVSEGRFLQVHSPATEEVVMQMSLPNKDSCLIELEAVRRDKNFKTASKYMHCADNSISKDLPFRATVRIKSLNYLVDVETNVFFSCEDIIGELTKDSPPKMEVVSPCQLK